MTTKATRDVVDLAVRPVQNIDINGGRIDGTPIGIDTPDEGHFTNLTAANLTVTNSLNMSGGATQTGVIRAYYADLAELYTSDKKYPEGTIVKLGGSAEITVSDAEMDVDVFGVISSEPAYVLNHSDDELALPVVLVGRVPCRVVGPVKQNSRLISNGDGTARAVTDADVGAVAKCVQAGHFPYFARVLRDDDRTGERLVEVAVVTNK